MSMMKGMEIIYECYGGSLLYGTNNENSDMDIRGIIVPNVYDSLKLNNRNFDTFESMWEKNDYVHFPIQKFCKLAMEGNPSVFEWLYAPKDKITLITERGRELLRYRDIFVSQKAFYKFMGFAQSEYKKKNHLTGNVGDKRRQRISKDGYDVKSCMNVIRLLTEAEELFTDGELHFPIKNRDLLMEIKAGEMPESRFEGVYNEYVDRANQAFANTKIRKEPDLLVINNLMINLIRNT